ERVGEQKTPSDFTWRQPVASRGANLPIRRRMRRLFLALLALGGENRQLWAQSSDALTAQSARPVFSMGQPRRWLPFASTSAILGGGLGVGAGALFGVQRPILNPITGLLSVSGEGLGEWHRTHSTAGVR